MKHFLTGLAAGLAIGYLTAPRPGKDTRQRLTDILGQQTKSIKDTWDKTVSQTKQLVDTVTSATGLSKPEPNLFADMESGKLDKYLDEADITRRKAKEGYHDTVENTADAAQATINKAEADLKQ